MRIIQKTVRNFTLGRGGHKPIGVCIHIMEGSLAGSHNWFNNPNSKASYHYGIARNGVVWQFVAEKNTAWSQGTVQSPTARIVIDRRGINPNRYLISIGYEGFFQNIWTEEMKTAGARLVKDICTRHNIPINRRHIIGHNEINSIRSPNCPGPGNSRVDEIVQKAEQYKISKLTRILQGLIQEAKKLSRLLKGRK